MAAPNPESNMSRPVSGVVLPPRGMRSRTQSISSDRPSTIALSLMSPPAAVSPEAAFIAASAASQIVTNDHDTHAETWYDEHGIEPAGETALVSSEAMALVNSFLDQLLFNFLSVSRATTLSALRPAVTEVLKPKLAKDAVNNADEELREYLGEGEEEDYVRPQGADPFRDWDLELVWKRTRLRCMVYSSLGDLEEEDEDMYMEQEHLEIGADEQISAVISPAVAIFLTSVLEYMGELTLTVAGQAAYHRLRTKFQKDIKEGAGNPTDIVDRIVVEEQDMERVALDRTLGRLWRGWKKRIRSPTLEFGGRPYSRASIGHMRHDSNVTDLSRNFAYSDAEYETKKEAMDPRPELIPLPMRDMDVDEIEVPGLAIYSDEEDVEIKEEEPTARRRPRSLLIVPFGNTTSLPTPTTSQPNTPDCNGRKRSNSLPTPGSSPYRAAAKQNKDVVPAAKGTVDDLHIVKYVHKADRSSKEVSPVDEVVSKGYKSRNKRVSRIITDTSAASAFRRAKRVSGEDQGAVPSYEKAEILTSARVSVAGSISPALSDSGGPFPLKRSNSVHSARIIDVPGPKSPSGSCSPSVDTADRVRPASVSLSTHSNYSGGLSIKSNHDDPQLPKVVSSVSRSGVSVPKSRSPVDRMRGSISNAATISESEEEAEGDQKAKNAPYHSSPLTQSLPEAPSRRRPQPLMVLPSQPSSSHRKSSSGAKVTNLWAPSAPSPLPEDRPAEISRKTPTHSNWHSSRDKAPTSPTHSIGMVSIERSKTRDDDDEAAVSSFARPIHTSGSSASSGTGRLKVVRTSEENNSRSEKVARNFEELIQSNQTITYTLTPENMRDIDHKRSLDQPIIAKATWKSDDKSHSRSRSSSAATDMKSHHRSALSDDKTKGVIGSPTAATRSSRGSVSARDARIPGESTADFAEFIKSTGPSGDARPSPLRSNPTGAPSPMQPGELRRAPSTNSHTYQAPRDPAEGARGGNSELIDFLRQGPPGPPGNRTPRTGSVFRESDELSNGIGAKVTDPSIPDIRYSQASTHATDTSMPSMHSSVNSNTALLKNKGGHTPTSKMFDEDDMMPKRTRRRVRDPYAIDFSDEEDEDDDFITTPRPPVKKEETLAEFLRNYEPPPEPVAPVVSQKMPKKKSSAPSLIGRFTRSSSSSNAGAVPQPAHVDTRSLSSRSGGKGYIPIQVNIPPGYDKYGPVDTPASRPAVPAGLSMSRVPMKKFEPREAVSNTSRTSDLAAFLRDSEPPPEPISHPPTRQEESSGLSKMFNRRKKSSFA